MGRFPDGLFHRESDGDNWGGIFVEELVKPLKKDVIRMRLKVWEQDQLNKNSGVGTDGTKTGASQTGKKPSKKELEEDWERDVDFHTPRFPRLVRDYLNSGMLANLIELHGPEDDDAEWHYFWGHKDLVLIAHCAMELGCTLPPGFLARLKSNYRHVCTIETDREQMRLACDAYIDGKPYHFYSIWVEADNDCDSDSDGWTPKPESRPPGLEPIPSQEAATTAEEPASKRRKVEPKPTTPAPVVEEYYLTFPADTCANCGATQGHGSPDLKRCKGCKTTLYCFEGCQKWHWFRHRRHCKVDQQPEESSKHDTTDEDGDASNKDVEEATA